MMHLAFCIDNAYVSPLGALMVSILKAETRDDISFHILSLEITEENKKKLLSLCPWNGTGPERRILFYDADRSLLDGVPIEKDDYVSKAAYLRLFLPDYIPPDIKKILYLDSDMIALKSLAPLWNTDISTYHAAVVIDASCNDIRHFNRLDIPESFPYFNSGMLLINLEKWREEKILEKALFFIKHNTEKIKQHDQDTLNVVLNGKVRYVSAAYNFIEAFYSSPDSLLIKKSFFADIRDSRKSPVLLHFAGGEKPWFKECRHPARKIWKVFFGETPWRRQRRKHKYHGKMALVKAGRRLLEKLGYIDPVF
jgi:lipopolysaccharide biosynthesis glycosyltransferase